MWFGISEAFGCHTECALMGMEGALASANIALDPCLKPLRCPAAPGTDQGCSRLTVYDPRPLPGLSAGICVPPAYHCLQSLSDHLASSVFRGAPPPSSRSHPALPLGSTFFFQRLLRCSQARRAPITVSHNSCFLYGLR